MADYRPRYAVSVQPVKSRARFFDAANGNRSIDRANARRYLAIEHNNRCNTYATNACPMQQFASTAGVSKADRRNVRLNLACSLACREAERWRAYPKCCR